MTETATDLALLYRARPDRVDIVDVPELSFLAVDGAGPPDSTAFADAVQALYAVSYAIHFAFKKANGSAPKVNPLEALWWIDDRRQQDVIEAVARGEATMAETDRDARQWQAMIAQPESVDQQRVGEAVEGARAKGLAALGLVRLERRAEGRCAQTLHVGPYGDEAPTIARLHRAITEAGYRPRGRHHEIYLGDPRRSAPEKRFSRHEC